MKKVPDNVLSMAVGLLLPYRPELTPDVLRSALEFEPEAEAVESLCDVRETAKALHMSVASVNRMLRDGQLPKRKIRGSVRIPRSAIADILAGKDAAT